MKQVRDIVNRDLVNLENCDQEPIHIPGTIQPHGFLVGLDPDGTVAYCSENTVEYLGIAHTDLLGRKLSDLLPIEIRTIPSATIREEWHQDINGIPFRILAHHSGESFVMEGEPLDTEFVEDPYDQTLRLINLGYSTQNLQELCQHVVESVRRMTGYDRVMVYRFDSQYNGEIFAETRRDDLEPFLGLHYPHTDIPAQAREHYLRNLLRIIPDIQYSPVPIYTNKESGTLDMSVAVLRSTSPIHVEYLVNMGVGATLTISLIYKGALWGLIACHHYSAKNIAPNVRAAAQLQGQFLTSQIDIRQANDDYELARSTNIAVDRLGSLDLAPNAESIETLIQSPYFLQICNATGGAIIYDGKISAAGDVPDNDSILELQKALLPLTINGWLHTHSIERVYPNWKSDCQPASGVVFHDLGNGNALMWFRPESVTEVHWGGDPNKAIIRDEKGLHPRKSFEKWKQIVKCQSRPWREPELQASTSFAHNLQKHISYLHIVREEEKSRRLNQILRETNAELENINWISTHDLQEPLRKIQLQASRLIHHEGDSMSPNTLRVINAMSKAAAQMQTLLVDIRNYTRLASIQEPFETLDLNEVLKQSIQSLSSEIGEAGAQIKTDRLPLIVGIEILLIELFNSILGNSLKFRQESPVISITSQATDSGFIRISITDNGVGFEERYKDNIFNIFTRLHPRDSYKGSGVGLAICRKIMQTHGGRIDATSQLNQGATITLEFIPHETPRY